MLKGRWYELRVIAVGGRIRLRQTALQRSWGIDDFGEAEMTGSLGALAKLTFAAAPAAAPATHDNPYCAFFNGRLEDLAIITGVHDGREPIEPDKLECLAWWDFSAEIPTGQIIDRGPYGLHGHLRNLPTRAVRGARWTGEETNWRHRSRHYAAIHFHQDDLYDCGWETDSTFDIPDGMASGVYGIRLRSDDIEDIIPVYVLPPAGAATAPIVFWPRPSLIRSMAIISATASTTLFARAGPSGMPIRGMPTSIPNMTHRPTTGTQTAAASAIRACAGHC
jgi:N,N-dimethylformamidase